MGPNANSTEKNTDAGADEKSTPAGLETLLALHANAIHPVQKTRSTAWIEIG
jgi:hypothetical protein